MIRVFFSNLASVRLSIEPLLVDSSYYGIQSSYLFLHLHTVIISIFKMWIQVRLHYAYWNRVRGECEKWTSRRVMHMVPGTKCHKYMVTKIRYYTSMPETHGSVLETVLAFYCLLTPLWKYWRLNYYVWPYLRMFNSLFVNCYL